MHRITHENKFQKSIENLRYPQNVRQAPDGETRLNTEQTYGAKDCSEFNRSRKPKSCTQWAN